jgi:toxin ParE1/3/4
LLEIHQYIARDSHLRADRYMRNLREKLRAIAQTPWLGHRREDITNQPCMFYTFKSHLIIYHPTLRPVHIIRVLHGSRDVQLALQQNPFEF